jgi:hypothetical protein
MIERYRVLAAMLKQREEFTISSIAEFSGVKESTVRTVLGRDGSYWEEVEVDEPAKRGGQCKHYRVKADQAERLRALVSDVFRSLGAPDTSSEAQPVTNTPLGILAAEDRLLRVFPQTQDPERKRQILKLAEISLEGGRSEADLILQNSADARARERIEAHAESAENLVSLCRHELDLSREPGVRDSAYAGALMRLSDRFRELGEIPHAWSLQRRLLYSPAWARVCGVVGAIPEISRPGEVRGNPAQSYPRTIYLSASRGIPSKPGFGSFVIVQEKSSLPLHQARNMATAARKSLNEFGPYVERGSGDLYRVPKGALIPGASPAIVKESLGASVLPKSSEDPFVTTFKARLLCARYNIEPEYERRALTWVEDSAKDVRAKGNPAEDVWLDREKGKRIRAESCPRRAATEKRNLQRQW